MQTKLREAVCSLAAIALVGCASSQSFTKASPKVGERVGIVSLLEPEITNFHFGFTVFTTSNKRLANSWNLDRTAFEYTQKLLRDAGYEVVDVAIAPEIAMGLRNEDDWSNMNFGGLDKAWVIKYQEIAKKDQLDALVVLREKLLRIGPDGRYTYHGSGIFSAQFAEFFTSVMADVIAGDPPHRTVDACIPGRKFDKSRISGNDITAADIAWAKPELESLIHEKIAFDLSSSGLVPAKQPCPSLAMQSKQ